MECGALADSIAGCMNLREFVLAIYFFAGMAHNIPNQHDELLTLLRHIPPSVRHIEFFITRFPPWYRDQPDQWSMFHAITWSPLVETILARAESGLREVVIELEIGGLSEEWMQSTMTVMAGVFAPKLPHAQCKYS